MRGEASANLTGTEILAVALQGCPVRFRAVVTLVSGKEINLVIPSPMIK